MTAGRHPAAVHSSSAAAAAAAAAAITVATAATAATAASTATDASAANSAERHQLAHPAGYPLRPLSTRRGALPLCSRLAAFAIVAATAAITVAGLKQHSVGNTLEEVKDSHGASCNAPHSTGASHGTRHTSSSRLSAASSRKQSGACVAAGCCPRSSAA